MGLEDILTKTDVAGKMKLLTLAASENVVYDSIVISDVLQNTLRNCAGLSTMFNLFANSIVKRPNDVAQYTADRFNEAISFIFSKFQESLEEISYFLDGVTGMLDVTFINIRDAMLSIVSSIPTIDDEDSNNTINAVYIFDLGAGMAELIDSATNIVEGLNDDTESDIGEAAIGIEMITETAFHCINHFLVHISTFMDDMYGFISDELAVLIDGIKEALEYASQITSNVPRHDIINLNDSPTLAQFIIYSHLKITGTTNVLLIGNIHSVGLSVRERSKWPKIEQLYCLKNYERKICATETICYE